VERERKDATAAYGFEVFRASLLAHMFGAGVRLVGTAQVCYDEKGVPHLPHGSEEN
jgi:hypothetical protein